LTTGVDSGGTSIGFDDGEEFRGNGLRILGADWQNCAGRSCGLMHVEEDDGPDCVWPLSRGQTLELGIVDLNDYGKRVVFVRCLTLPTYVPPVTDWQTFP
jgi:hypothetical protein